MDIYMWDSLDVNMLASFLRQEQSEFRGNGAEPCFST